MKLKMILSSLLLVFVATSLVYLVAKESRNQTNTREEAIPVELATDDMTDDRSEVPKNPQADTKVVAFYFHGNVRCITCRAIESQTREAMETGFPEALETGRLEIRTVNLDEPENEHFVEDYQLATRSVVLARFHDGQQVEWQNLERVWELVRNREAFHDYVQQATRDLITERLIMAEFAIGLTSAFWLGVLTSISPCPLATNIAAISFIGQRVGSPRKVWFAGLLYTAGWALTYLVLGILLVSSLLSAPSISHILQKYMNMALGPILILVGMVLLELISFNFRGSGISDFMQRKIETMGLWGAVVLGILFALSFCPTSAALFFGSLLPMALKLESGVLLPAVYGIATGLPVLAFALMIALGTGRIAQTYNRIVLFERWARRITGILFIIVGIYYSLTYIFGLSW